MLLKLALRNMARTSGPDGPKVQFGARMSSALVSYVMQFAAKNRRQQSDAARFLVEAGAMKLRELGGFTELVAWMEQQPPLPGHQKSDAAESLAALRGKVTDGAVGPEGGEDQDAGKTRKPKRR